jgi:hypothetical protein
VAVLGIAGLVAVRADAPAVRAAAAATEPPAQVCDNSAVLDGGPTTAPPGAVPVPAGDNEGVAFGTAGATYWFAPGTHTLNPAQYASIVPGNGATFVGAPGAVLDGKGVNSYAFQGTATGVTVEYLTVKDFGLGSSETTPSGDDNNQGVVNHDAGHGWTIRYDTIEYNAGAGVFVGTGDVIQNNCLTRNGQYGFSAYETGDVSNVTVSGNEISYNDTYDWESHVDGCGCTGGGKFWRTHGATFAGNYVHDNHSVGLWADTDNTAFDIEGNWFAANYAEAIIYEISYNALIKDNTFVDNAWGSGAAHPGFPHPAIYLSESGADSRVAGAYGSTLDVTGNSFVDNWGGVVLWENADRFCGSPANTSSGDCTLADPATYSASTCVQANLQNATPDQTPDYYDNCRWKTQNVTVEGNSFSFTPANLPDACTAAAACGFNGVFSNYGTYPDWSPYHATVVEDHITTGQHNTFQHNCYADTNTRFMAHEQGNEVSQATWTGGSYQQDAGSTFGQPCSSGPAEVAVDAAAGAAGAGPSLSWTQPVSGANRLLTVGVAVGAEEDGGCALAVTDNGTAMTALATAHTDGQQAGYLAVFTRTAPPTGTNTIAATVTGCPVDELTGGSVSFTGASQTAPLGTPVTTSGSGATPSATVTGTRANNVVVGFVANGSEIGAPTAPSTPQFLQNGNNGSGAGNSAAATQPSSGTTNTLQWTDADDWWSVAAVEVRS